MSAHLGRSCHVYVNDVELHYVTSAFISAPLDGAVTLTLTIIGDFSYNDGVYQLTGTPKAQPIAPLVDASTTDRGISLDGVPK